MAFSGSATSKLGLPQWNQNDPFLRTEFNTVMQTLDAAPGVYSCTSASRPSWGAGQAGRLIYETDTKNSYAWTGSAWILPASIYRTQQYRSDTAIFIASTQTTLNRLPDTGSTIGLAFTAPASGIVTVQISAYIVGRANSTGITYQILNGSTIGTNSSGTAAYLPTGTNVSKGIELNGVLVGATNCAMNVAGAVNLHTLTPYAAYNVSFLHFNTQGDTMQSNSRSITVVPQP